MNLKPSNYHKILFPYGEKQGCIFYKKSANELWQKCFKIDLRVAKVIKAEDVAEAHKLIKITVDLNGEQRTIFAGIKGIYDPDSLIDRNIVIVANLEPRKMRFGVSEGMLLAAGNDDDGVFLIGPDEGAISGMRVR